MSVETLNARTEVRPFINIGLKCGASVGGFWQFHSPPPYVLP